MGKLSYAGVNVLSNTFENLLVFEGKVFSIYVTNCEYRMGVDEVDSITLEGTLCAVDRGGMILEIARILDVASDKQTNYEQQAIKWNFDEDDMTSQDTALIMSFMRHNGIRAIVLDDGTEVQLKKGDGGA